MLRPSARMLGITKLVVIVCRLALLFAGLEGSML
jgi:hypothetical protein